MSTCKISYNGSEISAVDETAPVSVAYNNATIATLNDGDTKTLGCHGKVMASDVVIGSKTLNCGGKLMQGDIVVELVGSAPSLETWYFNDKIIKSNVSYDVNFTSNGVAYVKLVMTSGFLPALSYVSENGEAINVYVGKAWVLPEFRTIILDEPATGDLLTFLEANATKLS